MADAGRGPIWKAARRILQRAKLARHRWLWDKQNSHNETSAVNQFDRAKVAVGRYSYGPLRVIDGANTSRLKIGMFCSIAEDVTFILNGDHPIDRVTTFPLRAFVLREGEQVGSRGDITVADDVWIGHGAIVMSGVTLGRGSIVAAGAIVTRDVAPFSVVAGAPARHLRKRVSAEVERVLRSFNLEDLDPQTVRAHLELLESPLGPSRLDELSSFARSSPEKGHRGA
ncbi:CatB-related O-acetyltransferase [Curtobacterium caseinilyticum]|uniref:CatB-related O-acetyltransferase n=1 Tax=Curtobacterium caseinilyticum TaxID=3055137 RepID=A0ABT7TQT1_9MICO|nr:CatB-related O-acetyltransferase [Curtobacterium caseinilyticum]MDM7891958.1 CatB-related O-acetyltransferase [Curtobacterium caseinilyticum]